MEHTRGIRWMQIETTKVCNMRCTYCDRTITGTNGMSMGREVVHKIIEGIHVMDSLRSILIQGFGEPFLYNDIEYMVKTLHNQCPDISIQTVTNGMVMNSTVEKVIGFFDVLYCSVDSVREEYWKKVRIGGNIHMIKKNLKKMLLLNEKLEIVLNVVVSGDNMAYLNEVCDFAVEVGCAGIQLIPIYEFVEEFPIHNTRHNYLKMQKIQEDLRSKYDIQIYGPYDVTEDTCLWVEEGCYILSDGLVTPCCVMSSDEQVIYGNLQNQRLVDILNSRERTNFINSMECNERCIECKSLYFNKIWNRNKELPLIK